MSGSLLRVLPTLTKYYERELHPKAGLLLNLEQTALDCCQPLPAPYKIMIAQQETVIHCLLFISQPFYLHKLSPHTSSQPITSRIYQRLLSLLTNQIAHQGT